MFHKIALQRNDSFDVHPWPAVSGSQNSHLLHMFAHAVANNHLQLLHVVKQNRRLLPPRAFDSPLPNHGDMSAIHVAGKASFSSVLSQLIHMCDVNTRASGSGKQALHYAAEAGHNACIIMLLDVPNVEADSKDRDGRTPLWRAAGAGHEGVVKALLATGKVDAESKDGDGRTPLSWATAAGHDGVVKLLKGKA
jgi:ankyrin repeat protein